MLGRYYDYSNHFKIDLKMNGKILDLLFFKRKFLYKTLAMSLCKRFSWVSGSDKFIYAKLIVSSVDKKINN